MAKLEIHVPDEIEHHIPDLQWFISNMVRKLHINRYKDGANFDLEVALSALDGEHSELLNAHKKEGQFEFAMEAVDVGNQALLCAREALNMPKDKWKRDQRGT